MIPNLKLRFDPTLLFPLLIWRGDLVEFATWLEPSSHCIKMLHKPLLCLSVWSCFAGTPTVCRHFSPVPFLFLCRCPLHFSTSLLPMPLAVWQMDRPTLPCPRVSCLVDYKSRKECSTQLHFKFWSDLKHSYEFLITKLCSVQQHHCALIK